MHKIFKYLASETLTWDTENMRCAKIRIFLNDPTYYYSRKKSVLETHEESEPFPKGQFRFLLGFTSPKIL